ncbi:MAG: Potassium channel [Bathelium mastoideum]|nr:MAG: Potassium channel [Bathelium mastoideum]KAI9693179.1 MAG: Potassium channel [Bathelium mastoideum]
MSEAPSFSGSTPTEEWWNNDRFMTSTIDKDTISKSNDAQREEIDEEPKVDGQTDERAGDNKQAASEKVHRWIHLRGTAYEEHGVQDWWFASTAIPLLAATVGPLANVLSIAALVTSWRVSLVPPSGSTDPADLLPDLEGNPFGDPRWCYWLNVMSLIFGFIGQIFLFCNFTSTIRYIIALPVTILLWYASTAILIGIAVSMEVYVPPIRPTETYSQGYWYAVIAAVLYFICSMLLMLNMLGYFLGHYHQHFTLTDDQRSLILQTYLFFVWLAGGAAVFSAIETRWGQTPWSFVDGLYFCDVTILTVGFGDLTPTDDVGRGIVFPYSVGGIIMLGLVISSISNFTSELGKDKVVKGHVERARVRTVGRSVTDSLELEERVGTHVAHPHLHRPPMPTPDRRRSSITAPFDLRERARTLRYADEEEQTSGQLQTSTPRKPHRQGTLNLNLKRVTSLPRIRKPKTILLREERDRFNAMRQIQKSTLQFKRWAALTMSVTSFSILWCVGAVVFWQVEQGHQQMSYFEALYFCYVSLLTIGYGDYAPKSNAGRPIFIVWSLIAVPTMTVLISHMGDTIIAGFKEGTFTVADWTLLPKKGIWRAFLNKNPRLLNRIQKREETREANKRVEEGFQTGLDGDDQALPTPTIVELATEKLDEHALAKKLASAIRKTAYDLKHDKDDQKRYTYEDWAEFTRLIRFTSKRGREEIDDEEEDGLIDWDWIGEDSPMMAGQSEAEFVLDRLCESMTRFIRRQAPETKKKRKDSKTESHDIEKNEMKAIDEGDEIRRLDDSRKN